MNKRLGKYIIKKTAEESFRSYIPPKLPPEPAIDLSKLHRHLEQAQLTLAELNNAHKYIPNAALFIYMHVRKEALLSSQIEGTQSSFSDLILFENNQKPNISIEDVEEVSNYVKALYYGIERLKIFPLSLRFIREIHGILLTGVRGANKLPGEFRRSQNWIGGTRPSNALFVPPSVEHLEECLNGFEAFLNTQGDLPILIKIGLLHVQFETIHPFLDGNGRLGRLLIILLLCHEKILNEPILYLSLYLKENVQTYYRLLQEVRTNGTWETWLEFFLRGISQSAKKAVSTIDTINNLFASDIAKINSLGRARLSCLIIFEHLKKLPQVNVSLLTKDLKMTAPTARASLNNMLKIGILEEISKKKKDKVYVYREYLNLLERS